MRHLEVVGDANGQKGTRVRFLASTDTFSNLEYSFKTLEEEKRVLELRLRENTGAILQSIQQHLARWTASSASKPPGSPAALPPAASPSAASAPTAAEADLPAPPSSPVHSSLPGLHLPSHSPVPPHSPAHNSTPAAHPLEWSSGSAAAETSDEMQRTHFLVSHLTREIDQLGTQPTQQHLHAPERGVRRGRGAEGEGWSASSGPPSR